MNLPLVIIAQNLNVAVSTVHRIYRLFEESGTVDPLSPQKRLNCRRLDLRSELHVVGVILENPSMYLGELCLEIMQVFGIEIFPKYCVQDTEKIWTHEKEDSSSCNAAILANSEEVLWLSAFIKERDVSMGLFLWTMLEDMVIHYARCHTHNTQVCIPRTSNKCYTDKLIFFFVSPYIFSVSCTQYSVLFKLSTSTRRTQTYAKHAVTEFSNGTAIDCTHSGSYA